MSIFSCGGRWSRRWLVCAVVATVTAVLAQSAGAVVVRVGAHQVAGVLPVRGVSPASIPGSYATTLSASSFAAGGNLGYNGGIVLHGEAPYLIFWDPGNQIAAADKTLYERFFADGAIASGAATNVYSVDRQFTDMTGSADYQQTWSASHAITDTQPYPTSGQCTENAGYAETACLYDAQIQAEIARLVSVNGLPVGETGSAPVYFVVTPSTVNSCFSDGTTCADNAFCAYHSGFASGSSTILYADMATVLDANTPKACQSDNNSALQDPNGRPIADVNIKAMSHEFNETITDPNGDAWRTSAGNENGDNCDFYGTTINPGGDSNPNAFTPTLGGSATSGTLFNQLMNADPYYTQSEWSNGNANCEMRPAPAALSAAFSAPASVQPGTAVSLDPSLSSSTAGYTSTSWDFGDGSHSFARTAPSATTHTFSSPGTYTVTLTEVDRFGNLSSATRTISVPGPPSAAFSVTTANPLSGSPTGFDASASSEPGGSISAYSWDFGDGSAAGSGVTPSHTYAAAGTYTVTLTVTDATSTTATVSHAVSVAAPVSPSAAFSVTTANPLSGSPTGFDASASSEPGGSISAYSWDFGDGSAAGSGVTPSHTYAAAGTYTVTLTVTDATSTTATVSHAVTVNGVTRAGTGGGSSSSSGTSGGGSTGGGGAGTSGGGGSTGGGAGTTSGAGGSVTAPRASGLRVSPVAFAAARKGPSLTRLGANRTGRSSGATVRYTLNLAATVRFTIAQRLAGRLQDHGTAPRCVPPTPRRRKAHGCTRTVTLRGSFTERGRRGTNRLHFTGRLDGHGLKPGSYTLLATPVTGGRIGRTVTVTFRIG